MLRWCAKFESEKESPALVWKKGRNQHARALASGLRTGRLAPPFDAGPPEGPLGAGISSACAVAVGMASRRSSGQDQQRRAMLMRSDEDARKKKKQQRRPLVPGTASLRLAPPLLLSSAEEGEDEPSSSAAAFARAQLPSRVELAASLGAAAERIAELEWRLGEKERRAKASEWQGSVAAARASTALLNSVEREGEKGARSEGERRRPAAASAASSVPSRGPQVGKAKMSLPPSPSPKLPERGAGAAEAAAATFRRPKAVSAFPVVPTPQQQRTQQTLIPSVSLEELSRRISALAPQHRRSGGLLCKR